MKMKKKDVDRALTEYYALAFRELFAHCKTWDGKLELLRKFSESCEAAILSPDQIYNSRKKWVKRHKW